MPAQRFPSRSCFAANQDYMRCIPQPPFHADRHPSIPYLKATLQAHPKGWATSDVFLLLLFIKNQANEIKMKLTAMQRLW